MIPEMRTLYSDVLGEEKTVSLYLPADYHNPDYMRRHYPVIYVLDGEHYGNLVASLSQAMAQSGNLPETIVVAVHAGVHRLRDYTPSVSQTNWQGQPCDDFAQGGGGDAFLAFLEQALVPYIDRHCRTLAHRTLVGFSLGGLIGLHSFMTQPALFQAYLIIDASLWWDNQSLVARLAALVNPENPSEADLSGRLYCSIADHETTGPNQHRAMIEGNQRYMGCLQQLTKAQDVSRLRVSVETFSDETHSSVIPPSICHGLRVLFDGHRFRYGWAETVETVIVHFSSYAVQLGIDYMAPEKQLMVLAWQAGKVLGEPARKAFMQYHCELYPKSPAAWAQMGVAHEAQGEQELARACYNNALAYNCNNVQAQEGLQRLAIVHDINADDTPFSGKNNES